MILLSEVRKIAAVIGNETGNAGLLRDTVDAATLFIGHCHWFLYIDRLAGLHGHYGIRGVGGGWSSDIHGIHLFIVNQFLRIVVPFGNASFFSISFGFGNIPAHYSHYFGVVNLLESRSAFVFGYFSAANEAPFIIFSLILIYNYSSKSKSKSKSSMNSGAVKSSSSRRSFWWTSGPFGAVDKTANLTHFQ